MMRGGSAFSHVPCIEPLRCKIVCQANGNLLSVDEQGVARARHPQHEQPKKTNKAGQQRWKACAEWWVQRLPNGAFVFSSVGFGEKPLGLGNDEEVCCREDGTLMNIPPASCQWKLQRHPKVASSYVVVSSLETLSNERDSEEGNENQEKETQQPSTWVALGCNANGIFTRDANTNLAAVALAWSLEFLSGELCHIVSPRFEKLLQCHAVLPGPRLHTKYGGWETWRLIQTDEDSVYYITSWIHPFALGLVPHRDASTVVQVDWANRGSWEKWIVRSAPGGMGVYLISKSTRRFLCTTDGLSVQVSHGLSPGSIWHLNVPQRNRYRMVAASADYLYFSVKNRTQLCLRSNGLVVKCIAPAAGVVSGEEDDSRALQLARTGQYLAPGSMEGRHVVLQKQPYWWHIEETESSRGWVSIKTVHRTRVLSWNDDQQIVCSSAAATNNSTLWRLEPDLPRRVTQAQYIGAGMAATGGVATVLATPLAATAVAGMFGAEVAVGTAEVAAAATATASVGSAISATTTLALLRGRKPGDAMATAFQSSTRPLVDWRLPNT